MRKAVVYPGTFDPITNGHLDLIERGLSVFDKVLIAVAENPKKQPLFPLKERVELVEKAVGNLEKVEVWAFSGLLTDFCDQRGVQVILRGLRAVSDFEFELQMSQMNRTINEKVETVFMMPSEEYNFISSRIIKEVSELGGDVKDLVPPPVTAALKEKFKS